MADITQFRYATLLRAALGLKTVDPGRVIGGVVQPVFLVNDVYRPEERAIRSERLFFQAISVQNNLGTFNLQQYNNPPGSNVICVIRRIRWSGVIPTATVQPGRAGPFVQSVFGNAVSLQANPKDLRIGTGANAPLRTGMGIANGTVAAGWSATINSTSAVWAYELFFASTNSALNVDTGDVDIVLPPGSGVRAGIAGDTAGTVAYNFTLSFEGYERVLDPSELIVPP